MNAPVPGPLQRALTHKAIFWIPFAICLVADLASKAWAEATIKPTDPNVTPVIGRFLTWKWAENQGAAFSILEGRPILLATIACFVLIAIFVYVYIADRRRRFFLFGLGLVASGAIGNLYDRLTLGYVRDFIFFDVDLPFYGTEILWWTIPQRWPVWNVADAAIMTGVAILLIVSFRKPPKEPGEAEEQSEAEESAQLQPSNEQGLETTNQHGFTQGHPLQGDRGPHRA